VKRSREPEVLIAISARPLLREARKMTDETHASRHPDPIDEVKQLAVESIADQGNGEASASVPGASGHDHPRRRREVVGTVFDDPRINGAEHVTVTVPRGDTEALDEVRSRLEDEHTRSAGATVLIEGRPSGDPPRPTEAGSDPEADSD
jgi:hypothetical protein